ncbi:hypothetical protein GCM10010913_41710 [Paenibacillus aceti]|uniref:Uncharacterized protein n=1 Tax=Paenibacillus aceti TaxID=1820010 RepID=A0ABQ1W5F3_9BACL|nr:hypothetical protein GCM10010913_41710 [Paenibacillus aceti]
MNISKEKTSHMKRRPLQHIMESDSLSLINESLPAEWVIRDYKPDYGLDLAIECFEYVNGQPNMAEHWENISLLK